MGKYSDQTKLAVAKDYCRGLQRVRVCFGDITPETIPVARVHVDKG
jgi:hypothetical protein